MALVEVLQKRPGGVIRCGPGVAPRPAGGITPRARIAVPCGRTRIHLNTNAILLAMQPVVVRRLVPIGVRGKS